MVKADLRRFIKLGSSIAITIPNDIVERLNISEGGLGKIAELRGQIILEPIDTEIEVKDNESKRRHKVDLTLEDSSNGKNNSSKSRKEVSPITS